MYRFAPIDGIAGVFVKSSAPMNIKQVRIEAEASLARAQSSLNRQDMEAFCAAVVDLQTLVQHQSGQWQGAVNFLARSIQHVTVPVPVPGLAIRSAREAK